MRKLYLLVAALIVLGTVFALYGQYAVYRYPALTLNPEPRPDYLLLDSGLRIDANGAYLQSDTKRRFRAFQPDVSMQVSSMGPGSEHRVWLENIHPEARLQVAGSRSEGVRENTEGLLREIRLPVLSPGETLRLSWQFPEKSSYRFVAIGDTGGDRELDWGLIRASQLGADFVLHLGDLYYHSSELGGVGKRMNRAKIPVYTANGNHDFRGPEGNSINLFLRNIGPLNARFSLLGKCFINLDTGAYMYPAHKGERAALLAAEIVNHRNNPARCSEHILFTHKPMVETFEVEFPKQDHALHGYDSREIIQQIQQLGQVTLIAGHIHADFEFEQDGFKTIVSGSGLAHSDLTQGRFTARVLVGEISEDQPVRFSWALNEMPEAYHCSKKVYRALERSEDSQAKMINEACSAHP